ncbi:protein-glutamate O-methyltransferase CheR [Algivirga pacifica]|uniref:Protein-glutamate O-methyltransferase CheR n=1 Tax=Algivirga pacifica TaxID=1162670 RepID=A0ABP9DBA7_9BACT
MFIEELEVYEIEKLTRFIEETFHYDFSNYAMSSFRRRIKRLMEIYRYTSVDDIIHKLKKDPTFFQEFVSEITVNVTEMFRDPSFWKELRDTILPEQLDEHRRINIWHAGCSSGEEVISMAIMLDELNALDKANIIATDIDLAIISKAKKGEMALKTMALNQENYEKSGGVHTLDRYFTEKGGMAVIDPRLMQNISFRKHDLVKDASFAKFDLVLCRNVMIYFNQVLQNDVLKKLHGSLFRFGNLIIGSKESLIWCDIANKFVVVNNEEKIYKKVRD